MDVNSRISTSVAALQEDSSQQSERPAVTESTGIPDSVSLVRSATEKLLDLQTSEYLLTEADKRAEDREGIDSVTTIDIETRPDTSPEDYYSDQRNSLGIATGGGILAAAVSGPIGVSVGISALAVGGFGWFEGRVNDTLTVKVTTRENANGETISESSGDDSNAENEPITSRTTRITDYNDGSRRVDMVNHLTGVTRTTDTNQNGVATVTVSRPDTDASSSPRTNRTSNEDGVVSTTVTSPTGGTYSSIND